MPGRTAYLSNALNATRVTKTYAKVYAVFSQLSLGIGTPPAPLHFFHTLST